MSNKCMHFFTKFGIAAIAIAGIGFSGCDEDSSSPEQTLKIYMPSEYMSDSLIPNFEKQYNAKVIVEFFDSNEEMYTKVKDLTVPYDVLIPSDYMIERLLNNTPILLQPIDKSVMTNMSELSDAVKNLSFDPSNNYSIPYFWGNTGIVYDKTKISREELEDSENGGWNIYRNAVLKNKSKQREWKIYFYDSERDAFMIALKALGKSANSDNDADLEAAFNWLKEMNKEMQPIYVTDEVIEDMAEGTEDIAMAIAYSGDAAYILSENEDMAYFVPNEGTNVWYDAMVIPQNAENPKLANTFINYVMSYEASLENTKAVGYTSPNAKAYAEMIKRGGEYEYNEAYKPRTGYSKDEIYHDNDIIYTKISNYWPEVKSYN